MYIVYKITNKINNKVYIGITSKDLQTRWYWHCNSAQSHNDNYIFHKAIRKYGKDNFILEVLEDNLTREESKEREIYYIKLYDCCLTDKGYNMTPGGDLYPNMKGENSPISKITEEQFWQIVDLLQHTILSYNDIIAKLNLNVVDRTIGEINSGDNWHRDELTYPLRQGRSIGKVGAKNGMSKLTENQVRDIIKLLKEQNLSQREIAEKYNVHLNTINNISRKKTWAYLWDTNIKGGE